MRETDLGDLQAFAAVARTRSFRAAARLRGTSASALSEALRRLEAGLGVRLLNRTTRSVTPTAAGERLLERLSPALGEIEGALDALNGFRASPAGPLRLNVPTAVAHLILPGIVGRFCAAFPAITVEIMADDAFVDVLAAGCDAGIRYDERLERDMIAVPLGPREQGFMTAAAPAYLARHGVPQHPGALVDHACIRHRFTSGVPVPWMFERGDKTLRIDPTGPLVSNVFDLQIAAALAGIGVIHHFDGLLAPHVAAGALTQILADWSPRFSGPFLYYPSRRLMPAPLRAFVDFVAHDGVAARRVDGSARPDHRRDAIGPSHDP